MKDGFQSLEIEPTEYVLHFLGPARPNNNTVNMNEQMKVLKGQVKFILTKPAKIHMMSIKFKGTCQFKSISKAPTSFASTSSNIGTADNHYLSSNTIPLLPKLKLPLFEKKTILATGQHVIPWEMDIPNIYPRSLSIKRAEISYKVIVSISLIGNGAAVMKKLIPRRGRVGGGNKATIEAEFPITIQRHLLPYKELSPMIESKLYKKTVPGKYHFEVEAPQIICIEQKFIPMAIKYVSIVPNQKPVTSIKTRLVQTELYRRQTLSKSESDLSFNEFDSEIFDLEKRIEQLNDDKIDHSFIKYVKKTVPAIIHKLPEQQQSNNSTNSKISSTWKTPYLVRHAIHPYLSYTLTTPMLCIYHYIEVIFQFGQKFEEIKMKVPVIVASIPVQNSLPSSEMIKYTFEENRRAEYLEYSLENSTGSQLTVQQQKYSRRSQEHQRQQQQFVTSDSLPVQTWHSNNNIHDGNNKISRGSQILQEKLAQFANDNSGTSSNRIRHEHIDRKKNNCTFIASSKINPQKKHDDLQSLPRIAVYSSATESLTAQGQLRKIASAQDLSINRDLGGNIHQSSNMNDEKIEINEERPRTATPTMRSGHQCLSNKKKPLLQPIDVYLANGGKNFGRTLHLTERPLPPVPGSSKYEMNFYSRSSDDILVTNRRGEVQQQRQGLAFGIGAAAITNKFWQSYDNNINVKYQQQEISSLHNDSDFSSSSVTISITNRSNEDDGVPSLQSRPPSPAFCPAPGLPATIALRPQQQDHPIRAVEEWFPPLPNDATGMLSATNGNLTGDNREEFITISPTINTIASSTVLSPNAALAYYNNNGIAQQEQQKRFALSTISSLINDPLQRLSPSPSLTSYNNNVVYNSSHQNSCNINKNSVHSTMMSLATVPKRMRSSSSVDPDMQQFFIKTTAMDHYPLTSNNDNIRPMHIPHSPSTIHRFKHEQLPPLPSKASNSSSSMSITTPSSSFRHQIRDNNINPSVSKDEENVNKRLTLIYLEDSDEEEEEADTESTKGSKEEKKHGTANLIMNNNENSVLEEQPPRQSFQLTPTCIPPRRASSLGIPNNIPLPTTSPTFINNIHNQTTSITATTNTNTTATTMNHLIDDGRSIDTEEESNKLELFENLTPPELPRLSFGNDFSKDFGLSLGLNF